MMHFLFAWYFHKLSLLFSFEILGDSNGGLSVCSKSPIAKCNLNGNNIENPAGMKFLSKCWKLFTMETLSAFLHCCPGNHIFKVDFTNFFLTSYMAHLFHSYKSKRVTAEAHFRAWH